jgi:hypothetical protein
MNNYIYSVVLVQHPLAMYPLTLYFLPAGTNWPAANEQEFVGRLREILRSEAVKEAINGLMAQVRADSAALR